ncbi:MAG: cytochrome b N-terminal domain-containing protein, partial [Gemmatimonadota bacterium]
MTEGSQLRERLALGSLEYEIAPIANTLPYMLGGLTFAGIVILIVSGVVLDQFYDPSTAGAHDSLIYLMTRVPLGVWLRALHWWAASVVLVSVTAHLAWVFWRRSYARPREATWWSGVAMLALLFALAFTGTVLRTDQEGGEALAHAVAGAALLGVVGAPLHPDFAPGATLLARMHAAHVSMLPILLIALVAFHFWLIRHLGIHAMGPRTLPFTTHLRRLSGYSLLLAAGLGAAAAAFAPGLGFPAVGGVEVTKPYWPFLWIYAAENTMGLWGMIVAPGALFLFLAAVPLIDRRTTPRRRWVVAFGAVVLAALVGALVYGALAPQVQH